MPESYYPPGAFYFTVAIIGSATPAALLTGVDASFQEIRGLSAEFTTEEVVEGGENRFVHRLPKAAKYPNLVLKRGIVTKSSFLADWFSGTIGSNLSLPILPQNLLVSLLGADGMPLISWAVVNAWPLKWDVSGLNSEENKILMETLELSYNYFERITIGSASSIAVAAGLALL